MRKKILCFRFVSFLLLVFLLCTGPAPGSGGAKVRSRKEHERDRIGSDEEKSSVMFLCWDHESPQVQRFHAAANGIKHSQFLLCGICGVCMSHGAKYQQARKQHTHTVIQTSCCVWKKLAKRDKGEVVFF